MFVRKGVRFRATRYNRDSSMEVINGRSDSAPA